MSPHSDSDSPPPVDLAAGVPVGLLSDGGMLLGRVGEDTVLLARAADRFFAIGALCTHAVHAEFPRLIPPFVLGGLAFLLYSSRLRPRGEQTTHRGIGV